MPLPTIASGNVASAIGGEYEVANSCMFDDGDSAYMTKTPSGNGNRKVFTISVWLKRGTLGAQQNILGSSDSGYGNGLFIQFQSDDTFRFGFQDPNQFKVTNRVFRDTSGWYNIICAVDVTQSSNSDRVKIFVNGTQETSFGTDNTMTDADKNWNNTQAHSVGRAGAYDGQYFDGYLAEVVSIDGSQLNASSFGEFDEDSPKIWKPKDVSGLTFGTNGFYLDFEDSSNLGNDANGGTDLTESNLATTDQSLDTPTNNFCVMNVNENYYAGATFSQGNLKFQHGTTPWTFNTATFGLSSGKWYWELTVIDAGSSGGGLQPTFGIANRPPESNAIAIGNTIYNYGYRSYQQNVISNGSEVLGSLNSFTDNDVMGVYLDLDNNKLYFSKNGTLENSTGISITDPASTHSGFYFPAAGDNTSSAQTTWQANFGAPLATISSGNADANGYGNFEYSPNQGGASSFDSSAKDFYALCTKNLAEFGG